MLAWLACILDAVAGLGPLCLDACMVCVASHRRAFVWEVRGMSMLLVQLF